MAQTPKRLFIAAVLAATGAFAVAQTPTPVQPAAGEAAVQQRGRMDPAEWQKRMEQRQQRMQERRAQRMADLKARLKITAEQEGAWNAYTAAMQPPANAQRLGPRMNSAEFDKLTTPQRIDRLEQFATERQAQMKQRSDAIKTFYAQLSPEQQKLYDDRAMRGGKRGPWGGPGHGPRGGMGCR
ncbi:MAG: Spy/CpxP family protein refolding chaperone [Pseudomonadota bacterium]|nr:Spy/CpxP family protein refolding chaperone [Pseudomonadota bacterium]